MAELKITAANFENEVLNSDKPVLLDFYADWCGPCKMLAPVVHEIAEENAGTLKVGKINVDEQMELAMGFQVSSIPMLVVFKDGKAVALWVKPQIIGPYDRGRPKPCNSEKPEERLACDLVLVAIGQGIESRSFEKHGIPVKRGVIDALRGAGAKEGDSVVIGDMERFETSPGVLDELPLRFGDSVLTAADV